MCKMPYDPRDDEAQSACNAHPRGCGDEPHPRLDFAADQCPHGYILKRDCETCNSRPDFVGFLAAMPAPFTRAEIQALYRRAYELSIPRSPFKTVEERMYARLAETLDLLDAAICRDEEKVQGPECDETEELDEDWLDKVQEELQQWLRQREGATLRRQLTTDPHWQPCCARCSGPGCGHCTDRHGGGLSERDYRIGPC